MKNKVDHYYELKKLLRKLRNVTIVENNIYTILFIT